MVEDGENLSTLDLQHDHGENIPKVLDIQMETTEGHQFKEMVQNVTNSSIQHVFYVEREKVRNVMIHSSEELKLRAKGRNLVSVDKASPALKSITSALKVIICLCRNLVLVALVSNSFNLWMPLLLFIESFLMVGMWTHDVHYITEMYTAIFSSKLDLINMLRMMFNGNSTSSKI